MSLPSVLEAFDGDKATEIVDKIGKATARIEEIASEMGEAKATDTARFDALNKERAEMAATLTTLKAAHDTRQRDEALTEAVEYAREMKAGLANIRTPSKARQIGGGRSEPAYAKGQFLYDVFAANHRDYEVQNAAKAELRGMGLEHAESWGKAAIGMDVPSKSTLGTSDATGGWVIPNAIVDDIIKPAAVENIYRSLMTVVNGVTAFAVDLPFRSAIRNRAVIAAFGATKENVDLAYNGYTATMYTLARIYDIGNQFLRQSRGAAEQDVMQELAAAFAQGESFYIREGTGSSQPFGYTSALTNGPAAFRTTFTPSATTLAGSIATAVAAAAGALAGRGVTPTAAVVAATSYWTMLSQGTDTAGFFFAPSGGPSQIRPGTLQTPWGLPVYPDADVDVEATAAVLDNLVVADWKKYKVFFGDSYRVDSSDQAGTRWDTNLTGFRGEEEMGFDARPATYAGYAQMITDILP